ncbi:MAG: hypothetical protein ACJ79R_10340 [Anaeromyxobacteraceae bacterium]
MSLTYVKRGYWYQAHVKEGGRRIQVCPACSGALDPRRDDTEVCHWCRLEVHVGCATDFYPADTLWPNAGPAKRCTECPEEVAE